MPFFSEIYTTGILVNEYIENEMGTVMGEESKYIEMILYLFLSSVFSVFSTPVLSLERKEENHSDVNIHEWGIFYLLW